MEYIRSVVERLHEDETLTADVDDAAAKALLQWGEEEIKAGRPAEAVRQGIRTLNKVIARRAELDPAAAHARLEAAGLSIDDDALASLWTEALPEGEWAGRLLGALSPSPLPPATSTDRPSLPAPPSPVTHEDKETRRRGGKIPWWRRLLFWRKPE